MQPRVSQGPRGPSAQATGVSLHSLSIKTSTDSLRRFEDEDVSVFMEQFDEMNLIRIQNGLSHATETLKRLPEDQRTFSNLDVDGLYPLFEALNCAPALNDQAFLRQHFDEPFTLVQTKRRLKSMIYTPAMTYFLFQDQPDRLTWASTAWRLFKRPGSLCPTQAEFEHSIRAPLTQAMSRVQIQDLDLNFVPRFWSGAKSIILHLDKDLITHSLLAIDFDICKLALDHLQLESEAFPDILKTMHHILTVSPQDFWQSMGAIPANVWVEQFFNSKALPKFVTRATKQSIGNEEIFEDLFAWVVPFLASMQPVNRPAACRGILSQLLGTLQKDDQSQAYKGFCFTKGLEIVMIMLQSVHEKAVPATRTAALEVLDLIESHVTVILAATFPNHPFAEAASNIIREALTLDAKLLLADRSAIIAGKAPLPGFCTYRPGIWNPSIGALGVDNILLGKRLLLATSTLTGAEKFATKTNGSPTSDVHKFNKTFDALNQCTAGLLERVAEFDPDRIQDLFSQKTSLDALFAHMFSSDSEVRSAFLEVLKTVSGKTIRSEAIFDAARTYLSEVLDAFSESLQRIAIAETFAAASTLWAGCKDLLEALCSPTDGILRSQKLSSKDGSASEHFWSALWRELTTVFGTTEKWSTQGHDKHQMMSFCRSAMEFADYSFDQFAIITGALGDGVGTNAATHNAGKRLVAEPKAAMDVIVKWLRLRDPFLVEKSTALICKLLNRLRQFDTGISESAASYIKDVYTGAVRNNLTQTQKAQLRSAWEKHTGRSMQPEADRTPAVSTKSEGINLELWRSNAQSAAGKPVIHGQQRLDQVIANSTKGLDAFKAQHAQRQTKMLPTGLSKQPSRAVDAADFKKKREAEQAAMKKQRLEAVALAKRRANAAHTADEGSGLAGLGVYDVEHSKPKGQGVMVSSGEDSDDSEDDLDNELFGNINKKKPATHDPEAQKNAEALRQANLRRKPQGPVKKQRVTRTAKDMRARLAPDLSPLHQSILAWDYFHEGPFPPGSASGDYAAVLDTFRNPVDYQKTFQPLLLLEAWNGFLKAKEEITSKPFDLKILNRSSVDAFVEMSSSMAHSDGKEIAEGDIVLLSKAPNPSASPDSPHAIARVHRMSRKKAHIEVMFRLLPRTSLASSMTPNSPLRALKVTSITPLEREYGALLGLQYYDLCDEISNAKPSPLLNYSDDSLQRYISNYQVNKAQAKAIRSALDNDAFTLVQGPPGSGKTKTIVAIVGAVLSDTLRLGNVPAQAPQNGQGANSMLSTTKKLLVCAPSNAAVDELVLRFKQGIKTISGDHKKVNIVRIGRSDNISSSVLDVTLDELINKRLNPTDMQGMRDDTQKIMTQHQEVSAKLREARVLLDKAEGDKAPTDELTNLRKEVDDLRRSKTLLGTKVDNAKDNEGSQRRLAEQKKRQAQQEIIGEAHIICATLSGSGHDMFQNLSVEFETVVIDEAAQCVELSALIPLKYGCAKCILVGDPQQLPPTVFSKDAARFKYEQSLFVRMQQNYPQDVHLLDTQYRMHPEISKFPSRAFYDGRLLDGPHMANLRKKPWHAADLLGPFRFFDVQGQHQAAPRGHSLVNHAEVRVAMQLYKRLLTDFRGIDFGGKIGIITPYKSQLANLKDQFRRQFGDQITDKIEFNTTDAFQGRESEIIIFSCVRASPAGGVGFLQDIRRMNVGLTRAKSSLWVLGNSTSLLRGEYWAKLIEHAKSSKRFTDGDVEAIFRQRLTMNQDVEMSGADLVEASINTDQSVKSTTTANHFSSGAKVHAQDERIPATQPSIQQKTEKAEKPSHAKLSVPVKRKPSEDLQSMRARPVKPEVDMRRKMPEDVHMKDASEPSSSHESDLASEEEKPQVGSMSVAKTKDHKADVVTGNETAVSKPQSAPIGPSKGGQLSNPLKKKDVSIFIKKKRY